MRRDWYLIVWYLEIPSSRVYTCALWDKEQEQAGGRTPALVSTENTIAGTFWHTSAGRPAIHTHILLPRDKQRVWVRKCVCLRVCLCACVVVFMSGHVCSSLLLETLDPGNRALRKRSSPSKYTPSHPQRRFTSIWSWTGHSEDNNNNNNSNSQE